MSTIQPEVTVGNLVVERPERARVLERWRIDYCCGGKQTLGDACATLGVETDAVIRDLLESDTRSPQEEVSWADMSLTDLADNIVETHHAYLREELPRLSTLADTVVHAHGVRHPDLMEVQGLYEGLRQELEMHMMKEEQILFPLCRALETSNTLPKSHCGSVSNPIRVMEMEHDNAGNALASLRSLTHDYTTPEDGCNTYRVFLTSLSGLEADLHQHIHKENNILFPRAIEREAQLACS